MPLERFAPVVDVEVPLALPLDEVGLGLRIPPN